MEVPPPLRDWYFIAEQPAPAPHLAHPEGCAALRIVLVTVPCASRSCEHFPDGFDLHLLQPPLTIRPKRPFSTSDFLADANSPLSDEKWLNKKARFGPMLLLLVTHVPEREFFIDNLLSR